MPKYDYSSEDTLMDGYFSEERRRILNGKNSLNLQFLRINLANYKTDYLYKYKLNTHNWKLILFLLL